MRMARAFGEAKFRDDDRVLVTADFVASGVPIAPQRNEWIVNKFSFMMNCIHEKTGAKNRMKD
jgi:hypothetical protein